MNLTAQSPATGLSSDGQFGTQVDNPPPPKWAIPQTLNGTIKKTKGHCFSKMKALVLNKKKRMLVFKLSPQIDRCQNWTAVWLGSQAVTALCMQNAGREMTVQIALPSVWLWEAPLRLSEDPRKLREPYDWCTICTPQCLLVLTSTH